MDSTENNEIKDRNLETYDLDDLIGCLSDNVKDDIKTFEDIVNLDGAIKRELYLNDITEGTGQSIDGWIRFWNDYDKSHEIPIEKRKPIKVIIDSNGGSLTDTFTIIDSIKLSKTPVYTIVIGNAYSGGFFTAIAGHKRFAYPHSSFMMHEGATQTGGDAHKFVNYTAFYKKELEQLKRHVLEQTNISETKYEDIRRDDFWLTAEEAIQYGVIDEIITEEFI